jgi:hypothetical protein
MENHLGGNARMDGLFASVLWQMISHVGVMQFIYHVYKNINTHIYIYIHI